MTRAKKTTQIKRLMRAATCGGTVSGKENVLRWLSGGGGWTLSALTSWSVTSLFHGWQSECQRGVKNSAHRFRFMAFSCPQPPAGGWMGLGRNWMKMNTRRSIMQCSGERSGEGDVMSLLLGGVAPNNFLQNSAKSFCQNLLNSFARKSNSG